MKKRTRILGILTALTMLTGISVSLPASAAETGSRILVDINRNDGRKASYTKNANNWLVDGTYTYTVNGITCKLSGSGGSVDLVNNKILQLQDVEKTPTLTMDGAKIKDGTGNPTLKLEISGLSNGNHSIRTWHACADRNVTNSSLTLKIAGKQVASGLKCPTNAVLLQKWILNIPGTTLPNPEVGDLDDDGQIDIFDLGMMKRELLQ